MACLHTNVILMNKGLYGMKKKTKILHGVLHEYIISEISHVHYTATLGSEIFYDDKTCLFYRFHGTPYLTIEEIGESDDQIVALVSEIGSQQVSAERSGESDCSQNTDVAILDNSTKSEGKARYI